MDRSFFPLEDLFPLLSGTSLGFLAPHLKLSVPHVQPINTLPPNVLINFSNPTPFLHLQASILSNLIIQIGTPIPEPLTT